MENKKRNKIPITEFGKLPKIEATVNIIGFENKYQVSSEGNIYSKISKKYLKPAFNKYGYLRISFRKDNKRINYTIHKLVAIHFIPNPNNYPCINHIDGNKLNNSIDNLEWCTVEYNNQHAINNNLVLSCEKHPQAKLIDNDTPKIKELYSNGLSSYKIAKIYNVSR